MGSPYVGEIRMFAGNFAPAGWAFCDGSILSIANNDVLFTLIGTTYGGDGQNTFALPDLRGRLPMHQGNGHVIGETFGAEAVTLTLNQIPNHTHVPQASSTGASTTPSGNTWANSAALQFVSSPAPTVPMHPSAMGNSGSSQPHNNLSPYGTINFIISLFGIFPSQA